MVPLPDELKAEILADAAQTPSPTRRTVRRGVWLAVAFCGLVAYVGFEAMGRVAWFGRSSAYIGLAAAAFSVVAVAATLFALPRRSMFGPPLRATLAVAFIAPTLIMGALLVLNQQYPGTSLACAKRVGLVCMDLMFTLGAFPIVALLLAQKRGLALRPLQAGFGTGIAVGAWTGVGITLSCECTHASHVALGHVLPILILAAFGAVAAWWIARRG